MAFRIGDNVGDYRIVEVVGSGGAGQVFKVEHRITGRIEAMKVLLQGRNQSEAAAERFLREIKLQASLSHPNIASVHNAFWAGDELVMIMELVDGRSLDSFIERGALRPYEVLRCALQGLEALEYAHGQGITHRDIKPENIMLTTNGVVKLMDFGLAKVGQDPTLTKSGAVVGSLFYIPPEQAVGAPDTDHRADIYSFGAVLYEMVTGQKPFPYNNSFALLQAAVNEEPTPPIELQPKLPQAFNDAILQAMQKEPAHRFQSARDFRKTLETIARNPVSSSSSTHSQHPALKPAPRSTLVEEARQRRIMQQAAMFLVFLAVAGWFGYRELERRVPELFGGVPPGIEGSEGGPDEAGPLAVEELWNVTLPGTITQMTSAGSGRLAVAAGGALQLWSLEAPETRTSVAEASRPITAAAASPDGSTAAIGLADNTVQIWSLRKPELMNQFPHAGKVTSLVFSSDGRWLASGSADKSVRISDVREGGYRGFDGPASGPKSMAASPSGALIAGVADDGVLRLWSANSDYEEALPGAPKGAGLVAFSSNGLEVAVAGQGSLVIWDLPTRSKKRALAAPARPIDLRQSSAAHWLVLDLLPDAKSVRLFDATARKTLGSVEVDRPIVAGLVVADKAVAVADDAGAVSLWRINETAPAPSAAPAPEASGEAN